MFIAVVQLLAIGYLKPTNLCIGDTKYLNLNLVSYWSRIKLVLFQMTSDFQYEI
jgi:hypothetical protein